MVSLRILMQSQKNDFKTMLKIQPNSHPTKMSFVFQVHLQCTAIFVKSFWIIRHCLHSNYSPTLCRYYHNIRQLGSPASFGYPPIWITFRQVPEKKKKNKVNFDTNLKKKWIVSGVKKGLIIITKIATKIQETLPFRSGDIANLNSIPGTVSNQ